MNIQPHGETGVKCSATERRYRERTERRRERAAHLSGFWAETGGDWLKIDDRARFVDHARRRGLVEEAEHLATADVPGAAFFEKVIGSRDFLSADFLTKGERVARAVGRVAHYPLGFGTGFMVSPQVMMTNNHVLGTPQAASNGKLQFDYVERDGGSIGPVIEFDLEPRRLFLTHVGLDFSLVAVKPVNADAHLVARRGFIPLIGPSGKALVGQPINVIQHPQGRPQEVALRNNAVVDVFDHFLHYSTDTQGGSSGSPCFSDHWELAALHHSGVPARDDDGHILLTTGDRWDGRRETIPVIAWKANEGIRISSIVSYLQEHREDLAGEARELLDEVLQ